jgi:dipeptidyl aminopeptidase/acylaminoacyl peptidase
MRGPELVGSSPSRIQWTDDSEWVYFRWLPGGHEWHEAPEVYRVPAHGGAPEQLSREAADSLSILFAEGAISPDGKRRVTSLEGDLYLVERDRMRVTRITDTRDVEGSPSFRGDGEAVFFTRESNLYEMELDGGALRQLTDIREGSPPRDEAPATGQKAFLEKQQEELFEHIRIQKAAEAERDSLRKMGEEGEAAPVYIPRGERAGGIHPNSDGSYLILSTYEPAEEARSTMVPDWVTESGYTEEMNVRSKVGDLQRSSRVGLLEVASGRVTWLDLFPEEGAEEGQEEGEDHPDLSMASFMGWNEAGTRALFMSVDYDYNHRWLFSLEAASGELALLDELYDEAWVAGPCFYSCSGWLPASDRAFFVSEETGYAHLYAIDADGTNKAALTSGEWEVLEVQLLEEDEAFLLHTNEGSPFNQHAYTLRFDGSNRRAITNGSGSFALTPSPDGRKAAVVHSVANRPPELFLAELEPNPEMEKVTSSPTQEWLTYPWIQPEIVHVPAEDGAQVPARIYRPEDVGAETNGAAVIFVHGAGYLHNVHNYWSSYYREYMFHHFLASMGYTVLDIDYRGSAGYGRNWRTGIYRWMGGKDLSDQVDGARYLAREEGIDPQRIGLYGGSYGGFITLMALFTAPDVFEAGAALRSVTDWAHYNHGYTGRILNLPQEDAEAYQKSSPIYFAEGFQGHLLMAHGMVDTNVHFSDVVRLAQRLIELGKENWEMAVYPVENHGFVEPTSWTDEYRRIFELFERTIGGR